MTELQQITRKPLPTPISTNPKPSTSRTMPSPITAYELRSWIDTIPIPSLETHFPTTHPIYADTNFRLVVQQIVCDDAGDPARFILRVVIQDGCEEMMLRAVLNECPGATAAWCMVPVANEGGRVISAEGIKIALKKSVES
ncbi:hypothetical protein E8E11_006850 [Didymella keratinophila]|nr:hypothetical protein E8E11_006850 [Didymella keratinophila]